MIKLSKDEALTLGSIIWCARCAEQAAIGLYIGVHCFDDGSLIPYRSNLCVRCASGKGFKGATKITNRRALSAKQHALAKRWRESLHD